MKKNLLSFFALVLFTLSINAQEYNRKIINVSSNALSDKIAEYDLVQLGNDTMPSIENVRLIQNKTIGFLSIGMNWQKSEKWNHEIELSRISYASRRESLNQIVTDSNRTFVKLMDYDVRDLNISLRYNFNRYVFLSDITEVSLGIGFQPFLNQHKTIPNSSNSFPVTLQHAGVRANLGLKYQRQFTERWCFNSELYGQLASVDVVSRKVENPSFPVSEQRNTVISGNGLEGHYAGLRIGLGFTL